jgi:hypothetical protein
MTHHDESHEQITVAEFFEEYWPLLFFGLFFLMTMFLPLLFLEDRNWLYGGFVITLGVALGLLIFPAILCSKKRKNP